MELPAPYREFQRLYPDVWHAYDQLGSALHGGGPLDRKTRELVKLALAVGARLEGAVHAHTRLALEAGASAEEIRHVVMLALTTIGFPSMMAARTWVEDILAAAEARG
jgi:AhpD family alkylhydroperoxidase